MNEEVGYAAQGYNSILRFIDKTMILWIYPETSNIANRILIVQNPTQSHPTPVYPDWVVPHMDAEVE